MNMLLPNKINSNSKVSLIHTSSPVEKKDEVQFLKAKKEFVGKFPGAFVFEIKGRENVPKYLDGSEKERLEQFRIAIEDSNWLVPIYGGTGCGDFVRKLNSEDLKKISSVCPVISGFSDSSVLLNFLYFKLGLTTFHYSNGCSILNYKNSRLFLDVINGKNDNLSFLNKDYHWVTGYIPEVPVEGIAIGGNSEVFRDMLDICHLDIKSWNSYILFLEETEEDTEDIHRKFIEFDERGIFNEIRALVLGNLGAAEKDFTISTFKHRDKTFGSSLEFIEYILSDTISKRLAKKDPLHIIKIDNFGHNKNENPIIIPIGAKTLIHPDKSIEFRGPFVK